MSKLLSKLFCSKAIRSLTQENEELKQRLIERQEAINKTNAYWKRELRKAKGQKQLVD